ncbi:MAG: alpha/beta fold hydrolase [Actinomycetota bacterium]
MNRRGIWALAGAAAGVGAGLVAQHSVINRRRRNDPEGGQRFGTRRGERSRLLELEDGARIFVEETGPMSSRGAVFVHGSCMRTDMWHYQLPGIGGHRLIFYDLRGHGMSRPKGDAEFSIQRLVEDLRTVIEDSDLDEVVIVGHSVGGMIALDLCRLYPDDLGGRIKGLVLLNTTHRPAVETIIGGAPLARVERAIRRPLDALGARSDYVEYLRRVIKPSDTVFMAVSLAAFGPGASAKQIDFTYDMLAETPAEVIFDLIRSYRDYEVTEHLGGVNVPTLVIGGTHDRITIGRASEEIAERLPKAELKVLEGCGHMSMLERHREVNRSLEAFFDDVLGNPEEQGERG